MAVKSQGTLIRIGANSIAEVTNIGNVGATKEATDVTSLSDAYKQFISTGVLDGGEVAVSGFLNLTDTNGQKLMYDSLILGTVLSFSVLYATIIADWTFGGIVTNFTTSAEKEGVIPFEATIRSTGALDMGMTASGGLTALALAGTGGTISPAFGSAVRYYTFGGVSATSVTVTATAASHTIKLFVDGVYSQDLTSGSASAAIPVVINVGKKLTIVAYEVGKIQQFTEIIVVKTA